MAKDKRKRKTKLPFWKKTKNPELASLAAHIGKIIDNTSVKDLADLAILGGCAYYGHQILGGAGALVGAVGYKLSTTMGGSPPVSQIAGLGILASIGVIGALKTEYNAFTEYLAPSARTISEGIKEAEAKGEQYFPPEGICEWDLMGQLRCWFPSLGWVYFQKWKTAPEKQPTDEEIPYFSQDHYSHNTCALWKYMYPDIYERAIAEGVCDVIP
ncbi:hypothetical protein E3J49_02605 [Candidatus Bathyarchaeota archaeon]|nr:MAG: hypothetical protein E3J49_02605 [Candidatus Bathyarchaeota archaeon]